MYDGRVATSLGAAKFLDSLYKDSCSFFMFCHIAKTKQITVVVTENNAFFSANSMALWLFDLIFWSR